MYCNMKYVSNKTHHTFLLVVQSNGDIAPVYRFFYNTMILYPDEFYYVVPQAIILFVF
jgi:hypothetical protein